MKLLTRIQRGLLPWGLLLLAPIQVQGQNALSGIDSRPLVGGHVLQQRDQSFRGPAPSGGGGGGGRGGLYNPGAVNYIQTAVGVARLVNIWWKKRKNRERRRELLNTPYGKLVTALDSTEEDLRKVPTVLVPALQKYYPRVRPEEFPRILKRDDQFEQEFREDLLIALADHRILLEDWTGAERIYGHVFDLNPRSRMALEGMELTQKVLDQQRLEAARPRLEAMVRQTLARGQELIEAGQPHEAVLQIRDAIDQAPEEVELWNLLGDAHRKAGQLTLADQAYGRAMALYQ